MGLRSLDIPERNDELASWLERELLDVHLLELVAGLEAFRSAPAEAPAIEDLLGDECEAVLTSGLSALTTAQLQALLRHPRRLLDLQELVLEQGGDYWQRLPTPPQTQSLVDTAWAQIQSHLTTPSTGASLARTVRPQRRQMLSRILAVAALICVGVWGWWKFQAPPAAPPGWGWDRPGALTMNLSPPEYLNHLAAGAQDWFNKRPDTADALRTRLEQFRHGCDTLIAADHPQLAARDRDWLRERCTAWRGRIDEHLAALAATSEVAAVRSEADATVNKLIQALRDRAAQVG